MCVFIVIILLPFILPSSVDESYINKGNVLDLVNLSQFVHNGDREIVAWSPFLNHSLFSGSSAGVPWTNSGPTEKFGGHPAKSSDR